MTDDLTPIDMIDAQAYYGSFGVNSGESLQLPATLPESLACYADLDEEKRTLFCRASYWTNVSSRVQGISWSAAYAALVSAVEVFLPNPANLCACGRPTSEDRCPICNQPNEGPTKQFRDFVDQYAPGVPNAKRNRLYKVRSDLLHGSTLMPGDLAEIGFRVSPARSEAWRDYYLLSDIVQVVMVNWLASASDE